MSSSSTFLRVFLLLVWSLISFFIIKLRLKVLIRGWLVSLVKLQSCSEPDVMMVCWRSEQILLCSLFSVLWWCEWCQDYLCIGASHGRHWQTIARRPATEIIPCVFLYLLDWSDPANWFKISNKGLGNVLNTTLTTGQS